MATVIVVDERGEECLRESVGIAHMCDEHASLQIIERIAWAVEDADGAIEPRAYRGTPYLNVPRC